MSGEELHCAHCCEPIGMYEPLVIYDGLDALRTSRAADDFAGSGGSACFHADCFQVRERSEEEAGGAG